MPRIINIPGAQLSSIRLDDGARFESLTPNSGWIVYQQKDPTVKVTCTCFGTKGGCTIDISGQPPTVQCGKGTCDGDCAIRVEVPTPFETILRIIGARLQSVLRRS